MYYTNDPENFAPKKYRTIEGLFTIAVSLFNDFVFIKMPRIKANWINEENISFILWLLKIVIHPTEFRICALCQFCIGYQNTRALRSFIPQHWCHPSMGYQVQPQRKRDHTINRPTIAHIIVHNISVAQFANSHDVIVWHTANTNEPGDGPTHKSQWEMLAI